MKYECSSCGRKMRTAYSIHEWKKGWLCQECVDEIDMKIKKQKDQKKQPLNKEAKSNQNTTIKGDRKYNN